MVVVEQSKIECRLLFGAGRSHLEAEAVFFCYPPNASKLQAPKFYFF
jgi:hypothetical protein